MQAYQYAWKGQIHTFNAKSDTQAQAHLRALGRDPRTVVRITRPVVLNGSFTGADYEAWKAHRDAVRRANGRPGVAS